MGMRIMELFDVFKYYIIREKLSICKTILKCTFCSSISRSTYRFNFILNSWRLDSIRFGLTSVTKYFRRVRFDCQILIWVNFSYSSFLVILGENISIIELITVQFVLRYFENKSIRFGFQLASNPTHVWFPKIFSRVKYDSNTIQFGQIHQVRPNLNNSISHTPRAKALSTRIVNTTYILLTHGATLNIPIDRIPSLTVLELKSIEKWEPIWK